MGTSPGLPTDNDGWFKRHIIEALNDLKEGHQQMLENQQEMHESNIARMKEIAQTLHTHEQADQKEFSQLRQNTASLPLLQKIVYGAIGLILVAFLTAVITLVVAGKR